MSIATPISIVQKTLAARLRRAARNAASTLTFVPAEKLDYKPSETAHSCRELAQHIVLGNGLCLAAVGIVPVGTSEETDLEVLITSIKETTEQLAAYAEDTDENASVEFFGQPFTVPEFLMTAEWHISRHTAQIDYLQTIWGDLENHS
jgi:hypothetical protein